MGRRLDPQKDIIMCTMNQVFIEAAVVKLISMLGGSEYERANYYITEDCIMFSVDQDTEMYVTGYKVEIVRGKTRWIVYSDIRPLRIYPVVCEIRRLVETDREVTGPFNVKML